MNPASVTGALNVVGCGVARSEDVALNRLASDGSQLFHDEGWANRLHVPLRHFGFEMTKAEVDALSE